VRGQCSGDLVDGAGLHARRTRFAQPVAIVTEVDGSARVLARGRAVRLEVADPIERGAIVVLDPGARIVLAYPKSGAISSCRVRGVSWRTSIRLSHAPGRAWLRSAIMASVLRALRIRPAGTTLQGSAAMRGASTLELRADGPTACGSPATRCACAGDRWGPSGSTGSA